MSPIMIISTHILSGLVLHAAGFMPGLEVFSRSLPTSDCDSSAQWQLTIDGFNAAGTEDYLVSWSQSRDPNSRFDAAFGRLFSANNFYCGIGSSSACTVPTCFEIETQNVGSWIYQVANSLLNLNNMLNNIYTGIGLGQTDTTQLTPLLADQVFKWKDPIWDPLEVNNWVGAGISVIISIMVSRIPAPVAQIESTSILSLMNAGVGQYVLAAAPTVGLSRIQGINSLNSLFYNLSTTARSSWDDFSNQTFAGTIDSNGETVVDYIRHGAFVSRDLIPSPTDAEDSFKAFLVSKAINGLWRNRPVYMVSTTADLSTGIQYPNDTSWYSSATKRTYIPYFFDGKAIREPPGLSTLNGSFYGIYARQVAQSSARAWEFAGNNYTAQIASDRIRASFSDVSLRPFDD